MCYYTLGASQQKIAPLSVSFVCCGVTAMRLLPPQDEIITREVGQQVIFSVYARVLKHQVGRQLPFVINNKTRNCQMTIIKPGSFATLVQRFGEKNCVDFWIHKRNTCVPNA